MNRSNLFLRLAAGWLTIASVSPAVSADPAPDRDAAIVHPMIGETSELVVKIDPTRLALPDLSNALKPAGSELKERYRRWTLTAEAIDAFRTATGGQPVYATIGIPLSRTEWPVFFFVQQTPDLDRRLLRDHLRDIGVEVGSVVHYGVIVMAPRGTIDLAPALDAFAASSREGLDEAFAAVAQHPIQVLLVPPHYVRRTVAELMPQLPRQVGGGSSDVLTKGLRWAALGLDPARLRVTLVVQSASQQAAQRLADRLPGMLQSAHDELPGFQQHMPREVFETLTPLVAPVVEDDRVVLRIGEVHELGRSLELAARIVASIEDKSRGGAADKFRQILLAMHNYHDVYNMFPPRDHVRDEQGRTGLGWRVHLLPFLNEQKLFDEFRLDQPWDSPHNKRLLEKMPRVYQGRWIDVAPGRGIWVGGDGRCLLGMADGSVLPARGDIPPLMLLRLFQKNDGQPVDWSTVR